MGQMIFYYPSLLSNIRAVHWRAGLLLTALTVLPGWLQGTAQVAPEAQQNPASSIEPKRHPIIESGFKISWIFRRQIFWLDRDRVLFAATPGGKRSGSDIYIWDIRLNQVSKYADGGRLCYFEGFIRYGARGRGGQAMVVEGRFGEEKTRPKWPEDETSEQSPSDCRVYPYKTVPRNEFGSPLVPLAEGYGYLDFGNQRTAFPFRSWPIRFLRQLHGPSVNLPIESREIEPNRIEYAQHMRVHVLYGMEPKGGGGSWPKDRAQPIYLLDVNGAVQIRTIPYGPWIGGRAAVYAAPTVRGLFFTSHQVANRLPTGGHAAGAFVVEAGRVRQLVSGIPESARVSPDGCRAA
jgi:hypothetical protein